MKIFNTLEEIDNIEETVVALGNFDGVHKGHQQIILRTNDEVKNLELTYSMVLEKNLKLLQRLPYALLFYIPLMMKIPSIVALLIHDQRLFIQKILIMTCFVCVPLVWILVLRNHSFMHYFYTYRILIIASFAIQCAAFSTPSLLRNAEE